MTAGRRGVGHGRLALTTARATEPSWLGATRRHPDMALPPCARRPATGTGR